MPTRVLRRRTREAIDGYLGIAPWLIGFLAFSLLPLTASLLLGFTEYDAITTPHWVGLGNYRQLLRDPLFWQSLKVTAIYAVVSVPLGMSFGFSIAVVMNQRVRGLSVWRTIYYLPAVVSGVAVSLLWVWIFTPEFGILNTLLAAIGIEGPMWLHSPQWALPALTIMSLWSAGGSMVVYLAGLQGVPTQLYEAATIDGASAWKRFWRITVPLMTPVLFYQLVMGLIGSFQTFTQGYVMTSGGPANATLFYVLYLYERAFDDFKLGYASAMAWILFLIILALSAAVFRSAGRWVYYEVE